MFWSFLITVGYLIVLVLLTALALKVLNRKCPFAAWSYFFIVEDTCQQVGWLVQEAESAPVLCFGHKAYCELQGDPKGSAWTMATRSQFVGPGSEEQNLAHTSSLSMVYSYCIAGR